MSRSSTASFVGGVIWKGEFRFKYWQLGFVRLTANPDEIEVAPRGLLRRLGPVFSVNRADDVQIIGVKRGVLFESAPRSFTFRTLEPSVVLRELQALDWPAAELTSLPTSDR